MKTLNSLLKTTKNSMLVLSLLLLTMIGAQAQPLYTQDASGPNQCDGFASLDSSFVNLPVVWMDSNTGNTISSGYFAIYGLCPGDYVVTFNDVNNNPLTVTFTIGSGGNTDPCFGFMAVMNTTNTSGPNDCTGTAELTITGGTAPYSLSWSNNTNMLIQSNLCTGALWVIVTDANGCAYTADGYVDYDNAPTTDTVITIVNNTFPPNTVTDTLPTTVVTDCDVVHDSIASAAITSVTPTTTGVLVTWTIYDVFNNVLASYDVEYYNINTTNAGVYQATLIIYCDGRTLESFTIEITDQFEYDPASSSLSEQNTLDFSVVNPIQNELEIQFGTWFEGQITLVNLSGAVIFSNGIQATEFKKDLTDLSQGMYILHMQSMQGHAAVQIVK